jgi:CheY-like chemotaxis protein
MKIGLKKILVVDSDIEFAQELSSLFMNEGYDVEICTGITEAAERVKNVKYDCVIMDVNLTEMMGYKAVSILKAIDPKVQIIMTSADNTPELEAQVRKQNIFYYHIKSFDREELKEAVRDVFKKMGKSKEAKEMHKPQKVLIVDDDHDFITAIKPVIERSGYEIATAHNKEEATEKIEKQKPDLILLDIMMERITDGFNLCYKLKHDPEMKKIPVLAVSAITKETGFKVSPATDGEYFEADDYMEKPVKPSELLERIERLLKG